MKNKFCVIGDKGMSSPVKRTWKPTKDDAIQHAQYLLNNQVDRGEKPKALYVVEVVAVVGVPAVTFQVFEPDQFVVLEDGNSE